MSRTLRDLDIVFGGPIVPGTSMVETVTTQPRVPPFQVRTVDLTDDDIPLIRNTTSPITMRTRRTERVEPEMKTQGTGRTIPIDVPEMKTKRRPPVTSQALELIPTVIEEGVRIFEDLVRDDEIKVCNTVNIYPRFSQFIAKISTKRKCFDLIPRFTDIYDFFVHDKDMNPVEFSIKFTDDKIVTKRGTSHEGNIWEDYDGHLHLEKFDSSIEFRDVVEVHRRFAKRCFVTIGKPCQECRMNECNKDEGCKIVKKGCKSCSCDVDNEYIISYKTNILYWNPRLILNVDDCKCEGKMSLVAVTHSKSIAPFKTDINIILGDVIPRCPEKSKCEVRCEDKEVKGYRDVKCINVGTNCDLEMSSVFNLKKYDVTFFKTYFVQNTSADVEHGYTIKANDDVPSSSIDIYKDCLLIGFTCVDEVKKDEYFNVKLGLTSEVSWVYSEILDGDRLIFRYKITNRTCKPIRVLIKYNHPGYAIQGVMEQIPHKRFKDHVIFSVDVNGPEMDGVITMMR